MKFEAIPPPLLALLFSQIILVTSLPLPANPSTIPWSALSDGDSADWSSSSVSSSSIINSNSWSSANVAPMSGSGNSGGGGGGGGVITSSKLASSGSLSTHPGVIAVVGSQALGAEINRQHQDPEVMAVVQESDRTDRPGSIDGLKFLFKSGWHRFKGFFHGDEEPTVATTMPR